MADYDGERRVGFEIKLKMEAEAVLRDAVFLRSPVLSKLLHYLVEETANGRGDILKSYSVAVDVLGRPESFDCATDSSARVHMVRLRKALENQYAQHGPVDGECIYLRPGCYKVRLGKLAVAYPQLYRPLSDDGGSVARPTALPQAALNIEPELDEIRIASPIERSSQLSSNARRAVFGFAVLAATLVVMLAWIGWQQLANAAKTPISPVVELMPVTHADTAELSETAQIVSSTLANGLPRFKIAQVAISSEPASGAAAKDNTAAYRLFSEVEQQDAQTQSVFLRLYDSRSRTMIWSREVQVPSQSKAIGDALAPILAEVNGPFGAIATHSTMIFNDDDHGGYSCLVRYFAFLKTRDDTLEKRVAACLQKPVEEPRLRATMLATRAFFSFETKSGQNNFDAALAEARTFASQAVVADPNDPVARYAMARQAYFSADCVSARYYTLKAVEANPNSPVIVGNLASLASQCAYKDADKLLDRAFLLQSGGNGNYRLLLVLAAISQNRADKLAELAEMSVSRSGSAQTNYYLTETLLAAAQNRSADAARNWKLFSGTFPADLKTPDQKMQKIILSPAARGMLLQYLATKNTFGPIVPNTKARK